MERCTKPKADVDPQPSETNRPRAKASDLRAILREKLISLAESNDIAAIRLLLDKPELLVDSNRELSWEDAQKLVDAVWRRVDQQVILARSRQELDELLEKIRQREGPPKMTPALTFHQAVGNRLEAEANQLGLSAWRRMTEDEKQRVWDELRDGLKRLGEELVNHVRTTIQ